MRSDSLTACATRAGSCTFPSSTNQTPPAYRRRSSVATRRASRVFPTPPTPVSVTRRTVDSSRVSSATSASRPTKLVRSTGRFPVSTAGGPPITTKSLVFGHVQRQIVETRWEMPYRGQPSPTRESTVDGSGCRRGRCRLRRAGVQPRLDLVRRVGAPPALLPGDHHTGGGHPDEGCRTQHFPPTHGVQATGA